VVEQAVGVAQPVEVVEVDVGDHRFVGQRDVLPAELVAEVRAGVDQERLARLLVPDVDGEPGAFDVFLAGALARLAVAPRRGSSVVSPVPSSVTSIYVFLSLAGPKPRDFD